MPLLSLSWRSARGADGIALPIAVAVAAFHLGGSADELRAALEVAMRGIFDRRDTAA